MTAKVEATDTISYEGLSGANISGLMAIILAFMENYSTIQKYNMQQMSLSAKLADEQHTEAMSQINTMGGNDAPGYYDPAVDGDHQTNPVRAMNWLLAQGWQWQGSVQAYASKYSSQLNILNSKFNQMNTLYNGMVQGANQNSSDTTQTLQTDLSMIGTNGVLATLQTIAACA
jgi:hypothetical protein